jgi:hypothetical protein
MHQYNIGTPFERMAVDVARPFLLSDQGNCYFLLWSECFLITDENINTLRSAWLHIGHISGSLEMEKKIVAIGKVANIPE